MTVIAKVYNDEVQFVTAVMHFKHYTVIYLT